jgi:D-amino-acid dehydrogenase
MKICILGGGVIGTTSAYALAKRGHEVTLVERGATLAGECSFANGGQLSYSHAEPWANPYVFPKILKWMWMNDAPLVLRPRAEMAMIRWGLQFMINCLPARADRHSEVLWRIGKYSRDKMLEIIAETQLSFDYLDKGIVRVFSSQAAFDHACRQLELQRNLGCQENALSVEEVFRLEPSLQHADTKIYGGVHSPIDASGDVNTFTCELGNYMRKKFGTDIKTGVSIDSINMRNGRVSHITTSAGDLTADHFVVSLGAYTPLLMKPLGIHVPIYPMKGYSLTIDAGEYAPMVSVADDNRKIVYTRLGNRMRAAGTAEFAGYNDKINPVRTAAIHRGVKALYPKVDTTHAKEWACLRPSTPDGPPIIGPSGIANLSLNTGHGTLGWTQAAGSAALLADLIEHRPTAIATDGLMLARY